MNVMLSYRRTDAAFTNTLAEYLRGEGIAPWIDREGIKAGARWRDALLQELRTCDACVPVLSKSYLNSEHCRMEIFIARSFGRQILPVMVEDCFSELRQHEETKGLEDIFMVRMFRLRAVGLPIAPDEAFRRLASSIRDTPAQAESRPLVYVSFTTHDAEFATAVAQALAVKNIAVWIATLHVRIGENWRDAQARAMLRASSHLVVLAEHIVKQDVLRTEILLSEARGLPTFTVLPERLKNEHATIDAMMNSLDNSDHTYRRLAATQFFSCENGFERMIERLHEVLIAVNHG